MPLENLHNEVSRAWALWKITEDEQTLSLGVRDAGQVPASVTNPLKRLEFLAGRVLIKNLLKEWNLDFVGLTKDEFGKPFLKNHNIHLSLSHSYPYVAAIIDKNKIVGIDLEQPKAKLLNIAHRVLNRSEVEDAGDDVVKHCVYWCAKETLIKIHGKKDLTLAKNLAIEPFLLQKSGEISGSIIVPDTVLRIAVHYEVYDNFVIAFNK